MGLTNNWNTDDKDVIMGTYPKTGTMWTINILIEMIKQSYPLQTVYKTIKQAEWIENVASNKGIDYFNKLLLNDNKCPLRIWQTHAFYTQFPCKSLNKNTKIIYVTRNPKDVIVSSFHFFSKEPNIAYKGNFETFFDWFCDGITPNGNYFDHVMEWYRVQMNAKKNGQSILILYYEDMKENLFGEIKKIAEFIGCAKHLNDEKYKIIEQNSSFKAMKNASKSKDVHLSPSFFRKGTTSDWKNYLNQQQSQRIDRLIRTRFYGTNIKYFNEQICDSNAAHTDNVNSTLQIIDSLLSMIKL